MTKEVNKPTISLNLRPYCNLAYPYESIEDLDRDQILADVKFWGEVLKDIDVIMADFNKVEIPSGVEVLTKCKECGSSNLVFSSGTSKASGKPWYAFDCQDCTTKRGDKTYPTRNFVNMKTTVSADAAEGMGLASDDEVPF